MMKPTAWLMPGVALVATSAWIASQRQTGVTLDREIQILSARIDTARTADPAPDERHSAAGDPVRTTTTGHIDWKHAAGILRTLGRGGTDDLRIQTRLRKRLFDMAPAALEAELDALSASGLDRETLRPLEAMILDLLAEKAPQRLIARLSGLDWTRDHTWRVSTAVRRWATTEPAAAAAWLDAQIAAGALESKSLDGRNHHRLLVEGALMSSLLKTDPAAAAARVGALPADQRQDFLQMHHFLQPTSDDAAYAGLIRASLPAEKSGEVLAHLAGVLVDRHGRERVSRLIRTAGTNQSEKDAIVAEVIKNRTMAGGGFNPEELAKTREWASGESPAGVDRATGQALAAAMQRGADWERIRAALIEYHGSSGDEVLVSFLKQPAAGRAVDLIDAVRDPVLREQLRGLPHFTRPPSSP